MLNNYKTQSECIAQILAGKNIQNISPYFSFKCALMQKPLSNFVLPFEMQIPFHLFEKSNLFIGRNAREKTNVPLTEKNSRKVHTLF